jgi:hypothetical protein
MPTSKNRRSSEAAEVLPGKKYGMSGPAAFKRFWLMIVNRPFKSILPVSTKNINDLRKSWNDFHRSNFDEMEDKP